jgi:hypothetical protein
MLNRQIARGHSLLEVLISVLLLTLLGLILYEGSRSLLHGIRVLEVETAVQENAAFALQMIVDDLRSVGFSPRGPLLDGLREAERDAVEIGADWNGDGDYRDPNEVVGYRLSRRGETLLRDMGTTTQPMLDGMAPNGLEFFYFDGDGREIGSSTSRLTGSLRRRVRRIDVQVSVESPHPVPAARSRIRATRTGSVALRNFLLADEQG